MHVEMREMLRREGNTVRETPEKRPRICDTRGPTGERTRRAGGGGEAAEEKRPPVRRREGRSQAEPPAPPHSYPPTVPRRSPHPPAQSATSRSRLQARDRGCGPGLTSALRPRPRAFQQPPHARTSSPARPTQPRRPAIGRFKRAQWCVPACPARTPLLAVPAAGNAGVCSPPGRRGAGAGAAAPRVPRCRPRRPNGAPGRVRPSAPSQRSCGVGTGTPGL